MQAEQETDFTYVLSDLNNRVRTLENKYNLFGERLLIVNKNMIDEYKKIMHELKAINEDLREIRHGSAQAKEVITNIVREMEFFAKREQVKVLEKYIKLWDPMTFTTTKEVERMIEAALEKKASKKKSKKDGDTS